MDAGSVKPQKPENSDDEEGYVMDAAFDLRTGSMVFSEKGTLNNTYQYLLADDESEASVEERMFPACCYTDLCVTKCYAFTAAVGFIFLIVTVVMAIASIETFETYNYVKPFVATHCRTLQTHDTGEWVPCECNRGKSAFPCVRIEVHANIGSNTSTNALLCMSERELLMHDIPQQCTYVPGCSCDQRLNGQTVISHLAPYSTPGSVYPCLYNPGNHTEVMAARQVNWSGQIVKVVLPGVVVLLAAITIIVVWSCRMAGKWTTTKVNPQPEKIASVA